MLSSSADRGQFHIDCELKRVEEGGKTVEQAEEMIDFYRSSQQRRLEQEADPVWQKNNMEYDLRTTDWILEKVRASRVYSQNLYAAMCNRDFRKLDVIELLKESSWSCSWRYAGGIIADMRQHGDYIDWYCSGIRGNDDDVDDDQFQAWTKEQQEFYIESKQFVGESVVTAEIQEDLKRLGWLVLEDSDNQSF